MGLSIVYFKGSLENFRKHYIFLSVKIVLILTNSADPDKMHHQAAFHFGLHCLPKCLFRGFKYAKG